jgi:hypothetical protein
MSLSIIAKNVTGSTINISDLGFSIDASSQRTIYPEFNLDEIAASTVLETNITNGNIVINDGFNDLSATNGLRHCKQESVWYDEEGLEDNVSWDVTVKDMVDPSGFIDRTTTTLSFNNSNRTFTISPTGSNFPYYIKGKKYTSTAKSCVIPNVMGTHYLYLDATSLISTRTLDINLLTNYAITGSVFWDTTANASVTYCDERHGINMPGYVQYNLHTTVGPTWLEGVALNSFDSTSSQFLCETGIFFDEDIIHTLVNNSPQQISPTLICPIYYLRGPGNGRWMKKTADNYPLIYSGTAGYTGASGRVPVNKVVGSTWQLSELAQDHYVIVYYFFSNNVEYPIIGVQGQRDYPTVSSARLGALMEISNIVSMGLPLAEFIPIAGVLYRTNSTFTHTPKAIVNMIEAGVWYFDLRRTKIQTTQTFVLQQISVVQVQETVGSQILSNTTPSTITFATQNFIDENVFTQSGSRITILQGGTFRITYRIAGVGTGGKSSIRTIIRLNGLYDIGPSSSYAYFDSAGGSLGVCNSTFIMTLNAEDYVEVYAAKGGGSGTSSTIRNESLFLIELVGSS